MQALNEAREMMGMEPMEGGDELAALPQPVVFGHPGGQGPQDQQPAPPGNPSQRSYALHLANRRVEYERAQGNGHARLP